MMREELQKKGCSKEEIDRRVKKAETILNDKLKNGEFSLKEKDSHIMAAKSLRGGSNTPV